MDKLQQIPFLRLLFPLITGIITQYYFQLYQWCIIPLLLGLGIMLFSYFIPHPKQYNLRWLFGCGLFFFLFTVGIVSTAIRQQISNHTFRDINESYEATIIDIPQEKPNTISYKVKLTDSNKKIVCYLPKDDNSGKLSVGDSFSFFSKIQPFNSTANPEEFDYARYMYNKGYAGFSFIRSDRWEKTDIGQTSLFIKAAKCRQYILDIYRSLDLSSNEYAILAALTLGYTYALSNDVIQSFRTTGTAHILAVSGMHIGIIYVIILSLLVFIRRYSRYFWVKQVLAMLILWAYVFIIGLPPSAVRACIMISVFCISEIKRMKSYSLNTLCATAFLMLIWNPFQIFDLGFQLSFSAVLSMLLLLPIFTKYVRTKNKLLKYPSNILIVSLAAQIGTFPLCLYYFGTFPTYFFITNLLIIPLVSFIIYDALAIAITTGIGFLFPQISANLSFLPIFFYKLLIKVLTGITLFFENLPLAQLQNLKTPFVGVILLWCILASFIYFLIERKAKSLICSLSCCLLLISFAIKSKIEDNNSICIYNSPKEMKLSYTIGFNKSDLIQIQENKTLWLKGSRYLIIAHDMWKEKSSLTKVDIDYLHLTGNNSVSLYSLSEKFNIKKIILDSSLSDKTLKRFVLECEKLRIPYYDVSKNGTLRIFF